MGGNWHMNPVEIERAFREYSTDLAHSTPDGIIKIDLTTLHDLGLLSCDMNSAQGKKATQYFHVMESPEKVTLFNDRFIVWIVPQMADDQPNTYTLVALNEEKRPSLELIYQTQGVYNTPNFVLRILEHFLVEIQENDAVVQRLAKKI